MATLTTQTATIDRVQASKLLHVSVRTIDRYIKNGRIPAYQKNGRVWMKKSDVLEMDKESLVVKSTPIRATSVRRSNTAHAVRITRDVRHVAPSSQEIHALQAGRDYTREIDSQFYKELYEEAQKRLSDSQQKNNETVNKVSELESQIARLVAVQQIQPYSMVRQPERSEQSRESREESGYKREMMQKELQDQHSQILELQRRLERERSNKITFAAITYILLALQPIFWWLLK